MNSEIKLDLINKIANTNDAILLEELKKLIELSDSDVIYNLSDEQLKGISAAEEDIKYGRVIDHEVAKDQTSKWLKK
ncbi:hypothetical protein [Ekhidna sp.]|uniref:hypothetical protein n=1 Tax=Ekhidna sp. TaxID=2608089 RepID=UPI003C7B8EFE